MQVKDKNIFIIPLEDARMQIIIVPLSSISHMDSKLRHTEKVKALMKDIDASQIKKLESLTLPSFKIEMHEQDLGEEVKSIIIKD